MEREYFWLSDAQFAKIEPLLPTETRGSEARRRPAGDQRHHPCPEVRLSLGRCAGGIRAAKDALQSFRALGGQGRVGRPVRGAGALGRPESCN